MLEETKRLLIEEDLVTNAQDSDDDRMDFLDPEDEMITDKIVKAYRKKGRRLKAREVERISRGMADKLKDSVLSQVMNKNQHNQLRESSRQAGHHRVLRSLMDSNRSAVTVKSGVVIHDGAQSYQDVAEY